jgi:ATP-binding cassette, subfamily B, bacterial
MGGDKPLPEGYDQPIDRITARRVFTFFNPYRWRVTLTIAAILLTALIGLANPFLLRRIIDEAIPKNDLESLYLYVGLMILLPLVAGLIGVGQAYLNTVTGQKVMRDLRNALYVHMQRMSLRFFASTRTGEIQSRLANDVGGVQRVVTETATSIVSNLATALSTIVAMWLISWQLSVITLALLPLFLVLTYRVGRIRRQLASTTQRSVADLTVMTEETLSVSGMLLTKAFGRQRYQTDRFHEENDRLADLQVRQQMVGRWFIMIVSTFFAITPAFVYLFAGHQIITGGGALTIGDIVAFTALQSRLFFPLGQLLNVQIEIQGAFALFDRIFEYLDLPVEIEDRPGAITLLPEQVRGHATYRSVDFQYPEAPRPEAQEEASIADDLDGPGISTPFTLKEISFEARPGELVALVGPSGSGKTTIATLLPRFYDVTAGAIEIDGHDIRSLALESLASIIGIVTQDTYLFHASIRENIAYGKLDATQEEIEDAARAAAIHDRIVELPNGYDTLVGERGYKVSGGEKQRIAIARVILKDPRILILDEATSALDTQSERLIQAALERLMQGRTTLAIAHRLSTILAADQILVVERGRIVERGSHPELLAANGLYAALVAEQYAGLEGARAYSGRIAPHPPVL